MDFETLYYPNKNHGIGGQLDNTTFHLWSQMTNWIFENMGNPNVKPYKAAPADKKTF